MVPYGPKIAQASPKTAKAAQEFILNLPGQAKRFPIFYIAFSMFSIFSTNSMGAAADPPQAFSIAIEYIRGQGTMEILYGNMWESIANMCGQLIEHFRNVADNLKTVLSYKYIVNTRTGHCEVNLRRVCIYLVMRVAVLCQDLCQKI